MSEYQITCIWKPNRRSGHEHIAYVGNLEQKWKLTVVAVIFRIDAKQEAYFTVDKVTGEKAYIGVVRERGKAPYLQAYAAGLWNDQLLAQAECGEDCRVMA